MATSREKQLTLLAAVLGTSVVFLDATVTSVALPAIRGDLGGGLAGQQWVTNAYLLALGSLLLIGGSLGDVLGQKRVFLVGVAGFGLTSALCAVASSIPELCVFRSMQGVCAALVTPTALAVIVHVFPEDERARAIGTWTALSSIVGVIGPFIGGVLIAAGSWRLIFVLNAPLVVVTVTLIARGVPASASAGTAGRWRSRVRCSLSPRSRRADGAPSWSARSRSGFWVRSRLLRARREPGRRCSH
jgi:MFS family permease